MRGEGRVGCVGRYAASFSPRLIISQGQGRLDSGFFCIVAVGGCVVDQPVPFYG